MKREMDVDTVANPPGNLPPWHKPRLSRLQVSLDTTIGPGSAGDGSFLDPGTDLSPSDVRLKTGVSTITDALAGVLSLKGVTYRYDTAQFPEMRLSKRPQIGFVAQDLERVYPQLVKTRDDGFKAINYSQLVPVLVEAIKEQQSMIAELRDKIDQLHKRPA
jgi:hypothetical protein